MKVYHHIKLTLVEQSELTLLPIEGLFKHFLLLVENI